jgi:hypothetical protein
MRFAQQTQLLFECVKTGDVLESQPYCHQLRRDLVGAVVTQISDDAAGSLVWRCGHYGQLGITASA